MAMVMIDGDYDDASRHVCICRGYAGTDIHYTHKYW